MPIFSGSAVVLLKSALTLNLSALRPDAHHVWLKSGYLCASPKFFFSKRCPCCCMDFLVYYLPRKAPK